MTDAHISAFARSSMETPIPPEPSSMTFDSGYSPTPGADQSSYSSPGSASDHMGASYSTHQLTSTQPLYPGSAVLSAFEQQQKNNNTHVNRVITTTNHSTGGAEPQPQDASTSKPPERRQKRLERNRESARLSRRRRKHYLENLEVRVNQLSSDLDQMRRGHVLLAVTVVAEKRLQQIAMGQLLLSPVEQPQLSFTSNEMMIASSFQAQQLKSFSVPPSAQFVMWLTLQTDNYFRGGRAASERLSAARIGERLISTGTLSAAPSQSMWPLFCNEIGLSYDQEEKVRNFQRLLIQDPNTWLDRHSVNASKKVVQSGHDAVQALTLRTGQRERSTASILTPEQRSKLLSWSTRNRDRMSRSTDRVPPAYTSPLAMQREPSSQNHVSANLYILADRLNKVLETVPRAAPIITGKRLKKLSRRPCFESLGSMDEKPMHRENSSHSLKRDASEMSMDDDDSTSNNNKPPAVPPICPVEAQAKAAPTIQQELGFVQDLLPPAPVVDIAAYLPVAAAPPAYIQQQPQQQHHQPQPQQPSAPAPVFSYQGAFHQSAPTFGSLGQKVQPKHERKSSFLPAHLNVVPEEMWPGDEAEEFLLDIIDGDWAIGEGIDMDNL